MAILFTKDPVTNVLTEVNSDNPLPVTSSGSSDIGQEEDSPHVSGDIGVMILGVRNDANAPLTGTNGDYQPVAVTAAGNVIAATHGFGAHDQAAGPVNPTAIGGYSSLAPPTAVSADTDVV